MDVIWNDDYGNKNRHVECGFKEIKEQQMDDKVKRITEFEIGKRI